MSNPTKHTAEIDWYSAFVEAAETYKWIFFIPGLSDNPDRYALTLPESFGSSKTYVTHYPSLDAALQAQEIARKKFESQSQHADKIRERDAKRKANHDAWLQQRQQQEKTTQQYADWIEEIN